MAKRSRKTKTQKPQNKSKDKEYVVVTCVDDEEQAKEYEALLKASDVPVIIKKQSDAGYDENKPFTIMVPENFLDEAYAVIESEYTYDEFCDLEFDGENEFEYDSDLLGDDDNF
jgi:SNF2 family DNA or RNA helicase